MSLMVSDNSLYLKNPKNGEFLPVSIFNSGADKSMEKIAEFAETVKSEASTAMEARKTELVESMQGDADGIKAQIIAGAEVDLEAKKNQVLEQIPADYTELGASVNQLKDDLADLAPAGAAVGQLFRVAAISEDGKYTMEPVDMPSETAAEQWNYAVLGVEDYDEGLGMFVLDVGAGNRIREARFLGQIVAAEEFTSYAMEVGLGNMNGRDIYSVPVYTGTVNAAGSRMSFSGNLFNQEFPYINNVYRSITGSLLYGADKVSSNALSVDAPMYLEAKKRATNFYYNFNDPQMLKIVPHIGTISWAVIHIKYKLY